jgi:hypothetical protein
MAIIQRGLDSIDKLERAEKDKEAALEYAISDGTFRDWSLTAENSTLESLGLGQFIDPSAFNGSSLGVAGH